MATVELFALALLSMRTATIGVDASAPFSPSTSKRCPRAPSSQWLEANRGRYDYSVSRKLTTTRGGDGDLGTQPLEKGDRPGQFDTGAPSAVDDEGEYEYEYEYYEVDEAGEYPDDGVEYEYFEEEEQPSWDSGEKSQSTNEEPSGDNTSVGKEEAANDEDVDGDEDNLDHGHTEDKKLTEGRSQTIWRRGNSALNKEDDVVDGDATNEYTIQKSESNTNGEFDEFEDQGGGEENQKVEVEEEDDGDEDEEYLFTTPIPALSEKSGVQSGGKLQNVKANIDVKENVSRGSDTTDDEDGQYADDFPEYQNPHKYLFDGNVEPQPKPKSSSRRASNASKNGSPTWSQYRSQTKGKAPSRRMAWRPTSSSRASFIPPLFFSGPSSRSFSLRSYTGRPIYSEWLHSISAGIKSIFQPLRKAVQKIAYNVAAAMSKWVSVSFAFIRNSFDFLWYGPVDGVTTTGITTREGGLSSLSAPLVIIMSSFVVMGMAAILVKRLWHERANSNYGRVPSLRIRDHDNDEDNSVDDAVDVPPSVEEELDFLNRKFDSANPSSKDRITKAITKRNRLPWPFRRGDGPKTRRGQRQFTIKSIQTWWKERPKQQAIAIIEPQHLRNQHQPLSQEIKRLQKQLSVSEQERAILQQDVNRLQHRLQKVQYDARSIISQNKWLEKQTSNADRIVTKAVEVERRKANEEVSRVRESVKDVLERERMLMRSRIMEGGRNDLDLKNGPSTRLLGGVRIVRDMDQAGETDDSERWSAM